jgi:meso-butanediol dehydrogenase/(S,S)-butanediol dehydrogenase/diacetyl reductase
LLEEITVTTAFITGAGSGIGRATALRLAESGYSLGLLDLAEDAVAETASEIRARGGSAQHFVGDVTQEPDVARAVQGTILAWGEIGVAVPAAGIEAYGTATDLDLNVWDRTIAVNLTGTMLVARHTIQSMLVRGAGAFVGVSSDAGIAGSRDTTPYTASKHAVIGLVRCLAMDYGPAGIRSNVVCPGFVQTPMIDRIFDEVDADAAEWKARVPLRRFCTPEEVANAISHLASDEASYTNGNVYMIDGGINVGLF